MRYFLIFLLAVCPSVFGADPNIRVGTINKVTITPPASGSTLTIVNGKTLTASDNATVSGVNTGDQTITLTGDVTGSGTGSFATTIAADSVALTTDTTGNYVQSVATTSPLAGGAAGSEGAALTLSINNDGIGPTQIDETANYDWTGVHIFDGDAVRIDDTDASHQLIITPGSNLSANRVLTITTGDAARTITLNGDTTLTGSNTGDQTITLTGDVTGSGTGSFAATIANDAVTYAKIQNVSAASRLLGRGSAGGAGDVEEITLGANLTLTGTSLAATDTDTGITQLTGDVTAGPGSGSQAATIAANAVTSAKILDGEIVNADINASAAIARSKIAAGTAAHVVINDGSGNLTSEATLGAARFPALTGDVTTAGGSLATTIAAQNSAFWAGKITDETGTDKVVFNTSPTLVTPNIGSATGTGIILGLTTKAAADSPYTATASDYTIICNATAGAITINLPASSSHSGRIYNIKKVDSSVNAITIDANASETIDGNLTVLLGTKYHSLTIQCDGSNWHIL